MSDKYFVSGHAQARLREYWGKESISLTERDLIDAANELIRRGTPHPRDPGLVRIALPEGADHRRCWAVVERNRHPVRPFYVKTVLAEDMIDPLGRPAGAHHHTAPSAPPPRPVRDDHEYLLVLDSKAITFGSMDELRAHLEREFSSDAVYSVWRRVKAKARMRLSLELEDVAGGQLAAGGGVS